MKRTLLEVPSELNCVVPALRELLAVVEQQVRGSKLGASVDFAQFERLLATKVGAVESKLEQAALMALDADTSLVIVDDKVHRRFDRA